MREHLDPLVEIVQCELVFAHLALVPDGTVAPELPILCLLQKPAALSVVDVGGEVLSEVLMANGHLLQGILGPGPVVVELKEDGSPWLCQQVIRAF